MRLESFIFFKKNFVEDTIDYPFATSKVEFVAKQSAFRPD